MNLIDKAYEQAVLTVEKCMDTAGVKASALAGGYNQVWARDSMITFLGASLIEREAFKDSFKNSLETLARHQTGLGYIPLNVEAGSEKVYSHNNGGVDSNAWYIIGHKVLYDRYRDPDFLRKHLDSIKKAVLWLNYQDSNNCGLIEVHEAADWADLIANRGNVLYDNVLYYKALIEYAHILTLCGEAGDIYLAKAADVRDKINLLLWPGDVEEKTALLREKGYCEEWLHIVRGSGELFWFGNFYLPYASFRDFGYHCDALGNSLAILYGVADEKQAGTILDYFIQTGMNQPYPVMALYPPIMPGEKDWREYYRNAHLNLPYQYHNGGVWPFVGGFYIAALIKAGRKTQGERELESLARANQAGRQSEWEFNEWLHSQSGMPAGAMYQAWSAGMYIYAYHCVKNGLPDGIEEETA